MSNLILAIEDDQSIAELYEAVLTDANYRVRVMKHRPANVQLIEQMQPLLVVSDWGVKQEDINWNFIKAMQTTPGTTDIPILVCTTLFLKINNLGNRLKELKIKVLEKPFDIDQLLEVVEETISGSVMADIKG